MNFNLVISLIESAYENFKRHFPEEEPYFKIICTRKYGRADRQHSWRKESREIGKDSVKTVDLQAKESINLIQAKLSKKNEKDDHKNNPMGVVRVQKKKLIDKDNIIETVPVLLQNYDVGVDMRLDDPLTASVFRYCVDKTNYLVHELREEYRYFLETPMCKNEPFLCFGEVNDVEDLEERIKKIEDMKAKDKLRKEEIENLKREIELSKISTQSTDELKSMDDLVRRAFKESTTVRDVVERYLKNQKSLNDVKSMVMPLMEDRSMYPEFPLEVNLKEKGFIRTLGEFIDFLHVEIINGSDHRPRDHYDDDDWFD